MGYRAKFGGSMPLQLMEKLVICIYRQDVFDQLTTQKSQEMVVRDHFSINTLLLYCGQLCLSHIHCDLQPVCTFPAVPRSTQPSTLRGTVNEYQLSG